MRRALSRLPRARQLASSGELTAYLLHAGESVMLLREVGRLREVSFRAHAMGTGRVRDLDVLTLIDFAQAPQSTQAGYFCGSELSQVRRRA